MSHGFCEGIWLRRMLRELAVPTSNSMIILCDNKVAIDIANNPIHHDKMKYVEIDLHLSKKR